MDVLLKDAVSNLQVEIVASLDPTEYVLDYMFEHRGLTELACQRILNAENRIEMTRILIDIIKRKKIIPLFIKALKHNDSHTNLAFQLESKIEELKHSRSIGQEGVKLDPTPKKFEIKDKMSKFITKLHYHLKTLSHDGDLKRFDKFVLTIRRDYKNVPDIQFYILEAEFAKNRVYYQNTPGQQASLQEMERLVAYTTNPLVSAMVYLARKGSVLSMAGRLNQGLQHLQLARTNAEFIQPCKDTGTALYIQINLLLEHYESHPVPETKEKLIKNISEAIVHFSQEAPLMREDYSRLFHLKMAFYYPCIGVFGKTINCPVTENDLKAAESCLLTIRSINGKFDKRRQMFYCLARSVLKHRRGLTDRAVELAAEAEQLAERGGFKKELRSIKELSEILKVEEMEEEDLKNDFEKDLFRDLEEMERENLLNPIPKEPRGNLKWSHWLLIVMCVLVLFIVFLTLSWIGSHVPWSWIYEVFKI